MQLNNYKTVFISIGLIGILLFSLPTLSLFLPSRSQHFSELYILGPNRTFEDMPFNIVPEETYVTYIGVGNNLGRSSYYSCIIKIANSSEFFPDTTSGSPSELSNIYVFHFFVTDGQTWQTPLAFKVEDAQFEDNLCRLNQVNINGISIPISQTSTFKLDNDGFNFNLIVELWICDPTSGINQFNNRFVSLPLNIINEI